jgi:hypothetical protein
LDVTCVLERASIRIPGLVLALLSVLVIASELPRVLPRDWLWDFGSFVASGQAAREGLDPYGIYPLTFHVVLPGFEAWNPNLNPPISALLFQPLGMAEPRLMFRIWWGITVALHALTVFLALGGTSGLMRIIMAFWAFALAGFWDTLLLGQIYAPLVLAGVVAWLLLERGAQVWAGIMIGLVVAMKPNFAVWPALLLLSGAYRPALASMATVAVISAVPLAVYGPDIYRQWLELLASDQERAFFLTNVSLTGLASRAGVAGIGMALSVALLALAALWAWRWRPDPMRASAIGLVLSLLASPIAWIHYTLFLLPVLLRRWDLNGTRLVALLLIVPVPFIIAQFGRSAWTQFTVGSLYNWAMVLCLFVLATDELRRRARGAAKSGPNAAPADGDRVIALSST